MKSATLLIPALALLAHGCACCAPPPPESAPPAPHRTIYQFSRESGTAGWEIEDDIVMGGRSQGRFSLDEAGNAVFSGNVSLENNGGFSSVQHGFDPIDVSGCRAVCLGLKGDGKRYQLRIEAEKNARHSYAFDFDTSGDWQVVKIPFANMYAIRHGDRLDLPNHPGQTLAHIQILAGDGRPGPFRLEIDRIWLE